MSELRPRVPPDGAHLDDEFCDALLCGLIPAEAAGRKLEHARGCPECDALLRERTAHYERLRSEPAPRRETDGVIRRPTPMRSSLPGARGFRAAGFRMASALAAAAAIAVLVWVRADRGPQDAYWLPSTQDFLTLRSGDDGTALREAVRAYDRHDLKTAIRLLDREPLSADLEPVRKIYLASALVLTGKDARGLGVLDSLDGELPDPWNDEVSWIRALALEHLDRAAEAEALIKRLAEHPGEIGDLARDRLAGEKR